MTFNFNKQQNNKNQSNLYEIVFAPDIFSEQHIKDITQFGDSLPLENAQVGIENGVLDNYARRCGVSWFTPDKTPKEFIEYLSKAVLEINNKSYGFDLVGAEPYQYTVYDSSNAGEYKWHIDTSMVNEYIRKLSVSILLSDPSEFEGGKLLINNNGNIVVAEERKGRAVFFPSWMPHCVTPVTKGVRKSLVIWSHGPKFK
jgi:PKHD-type hydroxylase